MPANADEDPSPPTRGDGGEAFHRRRWRKHKGLALLLGAVAGGLAGYANTTFGAAVGLPFALVSADAFLIVLTVVVAPVVEEPVKLLALHFLDIEEQASYTPRRWMALGALAGIGFGLAEAFFYWRALAPVSLAAASLNAGTRLLLTVPLHGLLVTASAYGYGLSKARRSSLPLALGLAGAILAHAAFNAFQVLQATGAIP